MLHQLINETLLLQKDYDLLMYHIFNLHDSIFVVFDKDVYPLNY